MTEEAEEKERGTRVTERVHKGGGGRETSCRGVVFEWYGVDVRYMELKYDTIYYNREVYEGT